ncbi:DUF192 domain-containing protein [Shimia biformata]|uniref:DUF192 domain-containing protein n=1 Tax=Shimia biformata TaxID=1294299 RepID=UPI0019502FDC|nr:DUF192 domain-containing protein [Shimia biformata]
MRRGGLAAGLVLLASAVQAECRDDRVEIRGDFGHARFAIELADTAEERARGLMYREAMPKSAGMLFVYPDARAVAFWMQNTLIPLDMIFADQTGTVIKVHHKAIPHDRTQIPSDGPAQFVLEINGGMARAMGLAAGDVLRHPRIDQSGAAWPCDD